LSIDPVFRQALKIPTAGEGIRVGLFGGSFNPPHAGHLNLCDLAFKRLALDQIWWIVSPGNPLKDTSGLPGLQKRIRLCEEIAADPRIKITGFEAVYQTQYTVDAIRIVLSKRQRQKFVWLMGADNLSQFHQWHEWRQIADRLPIAVIDRPGSTLSSCSSIAALAMARYRMDETDASRLADMGPPAWTFLHGPRSSLSSTQLRSRR